MKDVSFQYSRMTYPILHDINLTLEEPGLYCIVGPNGVGKSTLIKCMNKIQKPTGGKVSIDGIDTNTMKLKEIAEYIGYVPVKTQDVFSMPVLDAVLLGRKTKSRWRNSDEDVVLAHRILRIMGIDDLTMRGFNELSAGQHQKVAICRGLIQKPKLLILDEPTANLDVKHQVYVTELLRGLAIQENMIVLMISHDLNISAKYAHEIILMEGGTIVGKGPAKDVLTEENIQRIYGVECMIEEIENRPHIVLGSVLSI